MCGIAGIVAPGARRYEGRLRKMVSALAHRGPDGSGIHLFGDCALGHARLAVVDLKTGGQPMLSPDSRVGVTFNGEIYGFREIRSSLRGYPFRTAADTEVILALYHAHGTGLLPHLPGMFAFALWDDRRQELVCARDRFGEKPFYYAFGGGGEFIFASEIKAIVASGLLAPAIDEGAVAHYLRYLHVHPAGTIYENVYTLPPAHMLRFANGVLSVERYWSLPPPDGAVSLPDAVERFRDLFLRSVSRQLVADVPVGVFLSGGLDSSTVVAAACRTRPNIRTFSFGFEEGVNELPFAQEVASLYATDHVVLSDSPPGADIAALLETMQEVYDEPFADSSNIPTWLIAKYAREHVKVILSGDGGDELLAGYPWYRPPRAVSVGRPRETGFFLRAVSGIARRLDMTLGRAAAAQGSSPADSRPPERPAGRRALFGDDELGRLGLRPAAEASGDDGSESADPLDAALRGDIGNYLPGDILVKTDRASMAHGLELRAPFLDVDLASYCISLPGRLKLDSREDKIVLRRAFEDAWPPSVRTRGKQGFGGPVDRWLARPSVRALKETMLNDPRRRLFSLLSFGATRPYVHQDSYKTWTLLVLGLWMEAHGVEAARARRP